jgi:hypothetical protein
MLDRSIPTREAFGSFLQGRLLLCTYGIYIFEIL